MSEVRYYAIRATGKFPIEGSSDEQAIERFHYLRKKLPVLRKSKLVRETREDLVLADLEVLND